MTANVLVPRRKDGTNHIADVGETSFLQGECYDEQDPENMLVGASISELTLTLRDEVTGQIINGRENSDIRNTGGGTLNPDGTWELLLSGADNAVVNPTLSVEMHIAAIRYKYFATGGSTEDGEQRFRLQVAPGVILIPQPEGPVRLDGSIESPLFIGDSYLLANQEAFEWWVAAPAGYTPGGAAATFQGNRCEDGVEVSGWSKTGTITEEPEYGLWRITVEMDSAETALIDFGQWNWALQVTEGAAKTTLKTGLVTWTKP